MTYKLAMGVCSVLIMLTAYCIYLWQSLKNRTVQPHPFSWFLWGFVTGVVYLVQRTHNAGAGSWVVGLTAVLCVVIGSSSLITNTWHFTLFDWLSLGIGLCVFGFYLIANQPTISAILATTTDVIGYGSTIRKGWTEPHRDSVLSFTLNSIQFVPALLALDSYSLATWLYPATLLVVNGSVASVFLIRRRQLDGLPAT